MKRCQTLIFLSVLLISAGCDHAAKRIAQDALAGSSGVSVAADLVRFELVSNRGALLSIGAELPASVRSVMLLGVVPLIVACVCALVLRSARSSRWALIGLGLVAGGGLANWLDRLVHAGAVTDFVSVGVGPLRTGIFNLADVSIFAGLGLLVFAYQRIDRTSEASAET